MTKAEKAYISANAKTMELIERLTAKLNDMPAPCQMDSAVNWSHVGTVAEVNSKLTDLVAFLGG